MSATSTQYTGRPPQCGTEALAVSQEAQGLRLNTLCLCCDEELIRSLHPLLAVNGTATQLCRDPELALQLLARWRFDAVVIDCDAIPRGMEVLSFLRRSPSNRTTVAFALVDRTPATFAFASGATFVLNKPVTREQVRNIVRAARGVMILGCRRYYRRPLVTEATFVTASNHTLHLQTSNISEGGLKVTGPRVPSSGQPGTITLKLPETETSITAGVQVVWSHPQEAGLRFTSMADSGREALRAWISKSFEYELAAMKPVSQNC